MPHDPQNCRLCTILRHPANAAQAAQLKKHLADNPFPKQTKEK